MKKYTIYQITNLIDGKIYIGKHETFNLDDGYMGSGNHIRRSIDKHGLENFKKEILHIFDSEEEMNAKEAELVTEDFCSRDDTYNICPGGKGGWGYINKNGLTNLGKDYKKVSDKLKGRKCPWVSDRLKYLHENGLIKYDTFSGRNHTVETRSIISTKAKQRLLNPENNSQYGTMWITNGLENKKIKNIDIIPDGWYKGRKIKK